jgi:hypothetical protein
MTGSHLLESFLAFGRGQAMYTAAYSLTHPRPTELAIAKGRGVLLN